MPSEYQVVALALYIAIFVIGTIIELVWRARTQPVSDRRMIVNFGLGMIGALLASLPWISSYAGASFAEANGIGLLRTIIVPDAIGWLIAVAALSFQSYWMHRAYHRFSWLWPIHRVHHSDEAVDLSTGFRGHPLEYVIDSVLTSALVIALGISPVISLFALLTIQLPSLLSHANVVLPSGVTEQIEYLLVTPRIHLRHHSSARDEHDSNFGTSLSLWDRLFGTWHVAAPAAPLGMSPAATRYVRTDSAPSA